MPATRPACSESLPSVADTFCWVTGTSLTGSEPYRSTRASSLAFFCVKLPVIWPLPLKFAVWMGGVVVGGAVVGGSVASAENEISRIAGVAVWAPAACAVVDDPAGAAVVVAPGAVVVVVVAALD